MTKKLGFRSMNRVRQLIAGLGCAWLCAPSFAAVAVDSTSSITAANGVSSLMWSHTASGSNRALVVGVMARDPTGADTSVSSVTYNSVAMTAVRNDLVSFGDPARTSLYILAAPATGTHTIVVTFAGTVDSLAAGAAISLTGVDQTTPNAADNGGDDRE